MNAIMPFVSIVVTAYLPKSKSYLDMCLRSIENLDYPRDRFDVLIVSPDGFVSSSLYPVVHPKRTSYWNSHALNVGADAARKDAHYFLFLNDDVVLTASSLKNLVYASTLVNDRAVLMALSNDSQSKYVVGTPGGSGPYTLDQIRDPVALMGASSPYREPGIFFFETLCLYAFLCPSDLWRDVGGFDDEMRGGDDIDFSMRVRQKGYLNGIVLDSLIYHAGGVSASETLTPQMRSDDFVRFKAKWGFSPRWQNV